MNGTGGYVGGHGTRMRDRGALVTGAGSEGDVLGTGAATALLLAAQGATVGILDADPERAGHTRGRIEKDGGRASVLTADITDEDAARAAVDELADRVGRLDAVVDNAGISVEGGVAATTRAGWGRIWATASVARRLWRRPCTPSPAPVCPPGPRAGHGGQTLRGA